jgi:hypothetical protein
MAQALIQYFILEGMHILYRGRVSVTSVVLWSEVFMVFNTTFNNISVISWWFKIRDQDKVTMETIKTFVVT